MYIVVEDLNEYAPIFRQDSYTVTVNEGRIIDPIIQVEAIDHDCSSKFNEICKYEIVGGDKLNTPFVIDANGNIKNTRALYYKESHNHILEVVAYDCGMKRSKPAIVNIKINKVCTLGWKGSFAHLLRLFLLFLLLPSPAPLSNCFSICLLPFVFSPALFY